MDSTTDSTILAPLAASETVTVSCSTTAAPACSTGGVELGRMVTRFVPTVTLALTSTPPPKTDCVAMPLASRSTASATRPLPVRTATRAATSLPSAEDGKSTATGLLSCTSWAMISAFGAVRKPAISSDSPT